jgi:hypothetical protein
MGMGAIIAVAPGAQANATASAVVALGVAAQMLALAAISAKGKLFHQHNCEKLYKRTKIPPLTLG